MKYKSIKTLAAYQGYFCAFATIIFGLAILLYNQTKAFVNTNPSFTIIDNFNAYPIQDVKVQSSPCAQPYQNLLNFTFESTAQYCDCSINNLRISTEIFYYKGYFKGVCTENMLQSECSQVNTFPQAIFRKFPIQGYQNAFYFCYKPVHQNMYELFSQQTCNSTQVSCPITYSNSTLNYNICVPSGEACPISDLNIITTQSSYPAGWEVKPINARYSLKVLRNGVQNFIESVEMQTVRCFNNSILQYSCGSSSEVLNSVVANFTDLLFVNNYQQNSYIQQFQSENIQLGINHFAQWSSDCGMSKLKLLYGFSGRLSTLLSIQSIMLIITGGFFLIVCLIFGFVMVFNPLCEFYCLSHSKESEQHNRVFYFYITTKTLAEIALVVIVIVYFAIQTNFILDLRTVQSCGDANIQNQIQNYINTFQSNIVNYSTPIFVLVIFTFIVDIVFVYQLILYRKPKTAQQPKYTNVIENHTYQLDSHTGRPVTSHGHGYGSPIHHNIEIQQGIQGHHGSVHQEHQGGHGHGHVDHLVTNGMIFSQRSLPDEMEPAQRMAHGTANHAMHPGHH